MMTTIVHEPWSGAHWASTDVRLCLVGESHYITNPDDDSSQITRDIVRDVRDGRRTLPFYTKVATLLSDFASARNATVWDSVAFLNFVPVSVGTTHDAKPTAEMWRDGATRLQEFLVAFRPTHVLSLGQRQWNHIVFPPDWKSVVVSSDEAVRIWHTAAGDPIAASWIDHPQSRGFAVERWRSRVATLLATSLQ
jgi:hypothetical protein